MRDRSLSASRPDPQCPWCDEVSALSYRNGERRMTQCASCGAWFVWPLRTIGELQAYYGGNREGMPSQLRDWREGTAQSGWYSFLARRIARERKNPRSIVDVGAGGLELTVALARQFPGARVEAWDLFADGLERMLPDDVADRIALRRVDLNDLHEPAGQFDVVACVAVIEHVLHPQALLRTLRSLTAPAGVAYVAGPEVTSAAHRILGKRWPYHVPEEHLTLPALESVRRAVAMAGGGDHRLQRIHVRYSLKYLLRYLRVPLPLPRALDVLLPLPTGAFELMWPGVAG